MHRRFSRRHFRNDIALLQLNGSVTLSNEVGTICLPAAGNRTAAGAQCYITGKSHLLTRCLI